MRLELLPGPLPHLALAGAPAGPADGRRVAVRFTTRLGGVSAGDFASLNLGRATGDDVTLVDANHRRVREAFALDPAFLFDVKQVHGTQFARVGAATRPADLAATEADGLVTAVPGRHLMMRFADCLPLVLFSVKTPALAVVHCGWRGVAAGIVDKAVTALEIDHLCDPADLAAAVGPGICGNCFEVGREVAREFLNRFAGLPGLDRRVTVWEGGARVDLPGLIRDALVARGLPPARIAVADLCTACRPDLYFSHRRDHGRTGRFAAIATLLPEVPS